MTHADFMVVILDPARRDDDAPRLEYADWLDEQGDAERAEFVRVQCELARAGNLVRVADGGFLLLSRPPVRVEGPALIDERGKDWLPTKDREAELFIGPVVQPFHGEHRFCKELDPRTTTVHIGGIAYAFRRGFVHAVTCTAENWYATGDGIVRAQPVEKVNLTTVRTPIGTVDASESWLSGGKKVWVEELRQRWPTVREWDVPDGMLLGLPVYLIDNLSRINSPARRSRTSAAMTDANP